MRFGGHIVFLLKTTSILMMSVLIPPPPIPIRVKAVSNTQISYFQKRETRIKVFLIFYYMAATTFNYAI